MGLFDLFSRKKKRYSPENWLQDGYLLVEELIKATNIRDVNLVKRHLIEFHNFSNQFPEMIQVILDKVDSGERKYKTVVKLLRVLYGVSEALFFYWNEEQRGAYVRYDENFELVEWHGSPPPNGIFETLKSQGKKFSDWKELEKELKLAKDCILGLIVEEKKLGVKLAQL